MNAANPVVGQNLRLIVENQPLGSQFQMQWLSRPSQRTSAKAPIGAAAIACGKNPAAEAAMSAATQITPSATEIVGNDGCETIRVPIIALVPASRPPDV